MKSALRHVFVISALTLVGQLLGLATQITAAAIFGASIEMDAFLAAVSIPNYLVSIMLGSLSYVFLPFFVEHLSQDKKTEAYELAAFLLNNCLLAMSIISILGILFAEKLLILSAPGLNPEARAIGTTVSLLTWPTLLAFGAFYVLIAVYQAEKKFIWQAVVPLIGGLSSLLLTVFLANRYGIVSLAIGSGVSIILQVLLLSSVFLTPWRFKFSLGWYNTSLIQVVKLTIPLILVAAITKSTPIIDRFLASDLDAGSISYLNYANKIVALLSALISTGGSTVIFPKLAKDAAEANLNMLRDTLHKGVRLIWLAVAPVVAVGFVLAAPFSSVLLQHGRFSSADVQSIVPLLAIYLFAAIGMCLGSVTAKGFYVLRDTKSLAVFGTLETLAYVIYIIPLTKKFGATGIAISGVLYFNLSIVWQVILLNRKLGEAKYFAIFGCPVKILAAALLSAGAAAMILAMVEGDFNKVIWGSLISISTYFITLKILKSNEIELLESALRQRGEA